jgi:hypothetical protein
MCDTDASDARKELFVHFEREMLLQNVSINKKLSNNSKQLILEPLKYDLEENGHGRARSYSNA